ncbi:MAG TPA: LacI family DNA-binding transcriptional regulator [Ktedonobacterales bacterium]
MSKQVATIKDVAQRVGVSVSTVSRVLNRSSYVSPETERLVLQAIDDLHFAPSQIARGFVNKKTSTIGLIIPDVANPFFADVARGVEDCAIEDGFATILCNSDWRSERESMYLDLLRGHWVEGVVVVGSRSSAEQLARAIGKAPYVLVERLLVGAGAAVWTDNRRGGALATRHLVDVGCRTFAHISGPPDSPSATERRKGFMDVMRGAAVASYEIFEGDYRVQSGLEIGRQIFARDKMPDGIFAANDLMAIGVMQAAAQAGIRIPEQVAVVGYDNISPADYTSPSLTTIDQPGYEMGRAAFSILLKRLRHADYAPDEQIEFQPRLVVRNSTRRPPD